MSKFGDWYIAVRPCKFVRNGPYFVAWCAKTPELGDNPLAVDFSETVYFEHGDTADEAIRKLKRSIGQ